MLGVLAAGIAGGIAACTRQPSPSKGSVVLYSSVDDEYLRLVVDRFEKSFGIRVLVKGDTEATKTTGLVERLRAEHAAGKPGADVWWSSEPFLTIALADEGVLTPMADEVFGDLPKEHRGEDNLWGCFSLRSRVVVRHAKAGTGPVDVFSRSFTSQGPAIARAAFGTTRGHFAAVLASIGEPAYVAWLKALKEGGAKVLDGNSAVVRAVASREANVGLTDTDDVWAGLREGWPIEGVPAISSPSGGGTMMIPNTVALVKNGPNAAAAALAKFIMSEEVERLLMDSGSHNMPVRPGLMSEMRERFAPFVVEAGTAATNANASGTPDRRRPTLRDIAAAAPRAVELARAEGLA
jgi:iron(III) transport system substrate-binding protein